MRPPYPRLAFDCEGSAAEPFCPWWRWTGKAARFLHCRKSPRFERRFEAAVSLQQRRSTRRANAGCARQLVGGIAAQGDEIRNLLGFDAISRANLGGTDACHLAGTNGIKNGGAVRGELEGVAVAARNENSAAALFFFCGSGGEKIIGLEACALSHSESRRRLQILAAIQLLKQGVVEFATALVGRKLLVSVGRNLQRVPPTSTARGCSSR